MPLYEYKCTEPDCQATCEKLVKFSDPTPDCPVCGKQSLEKLLSTGSSFCLMGYGWHRPGMSVGNK